MSAGNKDKARELLESRDIDGLLKCARGNRSALRLLFSLTYDKDELIRWRAVEAVGKVAGALAESKIEKIRDFIRRLMWLMNDESGGLGWHAPEAIGEILVNVPELIDEYGKLLPKYCGEEPFERGTHLAIHRIASVNSALFADSIPELCGSLENQDPFISSYAALALSAVGVKSSLPAIKQLQVDNTLFTYYDFDSGILRETTVGQTAKKAAELLNSSGTLPTVKQKLPV